MPCRSRRCDSHASVCSWSPFWLGSYFALLLESLRDDLESTATLAGDAGTRHRFPGAPEGAPGSGPGAAFSLCDRLRQMQGPEPSPMGGGKQRVAVGAQAQVVERDVG